MFAALLLAQAVTIFVGGQPLQTNPGPIEQSGRVFVPMRAIFERLGASVVYAAGNINATRGPTTVALRIGSAQATINGQPTQLDVAPFIVGASTFVPLRFVAQSLGAVVNYNDSTRVVAITPPRGGYAPPPYNPPPPPPPVQLYSLQPAPNVYVNNQFATIGAQFNQPARPGSVTVWLDGNNVTYRAGVNGRGFSYVPPAPLAPGSHTVRVAGVAQNGARFDRSWSFTVNGAAPPPPSAITLTNITPGAGTTIANRFATISANFSRAVNASTVRVWLDGVDRTNQCGISANGFSYKPPAPLSFGSHTVRTTFQGPGGANFNRSWSFTIQNQNAGIFLNVTQPSGTAVGTTFTVSGKTVGNGKIGVTVGATPNNSGLASASTTAGPGGNFSVTLSFNRQPGQSSITVRIVATNPVTLQRTGQTLQLRIR